MNLKKLWKILVETLDDQCLHCGGLAHCLENQVALTYKQNPEVCESMRPVLKFTQDSKELRIKE